MVTNFSFEVHNTFAQVTGCTIGEAIFKAAEKSCPDDGRSYRVYAMGLWFYACPLDECEDHMRIHESGKALPVLQLDCLYTHKEKGGIYRILGAALAKGKRGWSVLYLAVEEGGTPYLCLRGLNNFKEKFDKLQDLS